MLRSAAITVIQRGLGFRDDLTNEIISALQEAQRLEELGKDLPYFLKQEDEAFAITSGTGEIALPTGFIQEVQGETFHFRDGTTNNRVYLEKFIDLQRLRQTLDTSDAVPGAPKAYYLRKATVLVYPERDAAYSATWSYYKQAESLATDIENSWLAYAPDLLIGKAGMIICEDIGISDPGMQARQTRFTRRYAEARNGLFAQGEERERENYPTSMGSRL
jgi:hypothetical protein